MRTGLPAHPPARQRLVAQILELPVEVVVPGHGPITEKRGVRAVRDEARARFDAGLSAYDAAMDISFADFDSWGEPERIVVNVATLCREFASTGQSIRSN